MSPSAPKGKPKRHIPEATEEELNNFYADFASTGLSIVPEHSDKYVPQVMFKQFPKVLLDLKDKSAISLNFKDLLYRCDDIVIHVSEEEAINAESSTKRQLLRIRCGMT